MSSAIEVLKSKKSICDLCKYDNNKSCDASGGEFGECKPADDFYKAIQEAIVALEKLKKISFILETRIEDVEENIDCLEQELKTLGKEDEIIETELTAYQDHLEDLKEIEKELEGEQK